MPHEPVPSPHSPRSSTLVLAALGIVFGDLGTSPLYTMQECFTGPHGVAPTHEHILGVLSLVFWSLMMVITLKYVLFLMRADNQGEGGILALLALVPKRFAPTLGPKIGIVPILALIGAALLFGDGVITPAISVLSAVEGLGVATPALRPAIVPVTVAVLVALFAVQSRGTGSLGRLFGPVMVAWFGAIGFLGLQQILHNHSVLQALSPTWGMDMLFGHGWRGLEILGGVVLAVTGGEALYADMGHFGRRPIRRAWLYICLPGLLLSYFGQGAYLLDNPEGVGEPFYRICPPHLLYPLIILATAATVIASQALISGVFSLATQAIRMSLLPRMIVRHTSSAAEGQIYIPLLNWGLAFACIVLVLIFQHSAKLAAAYGLAVSGTMAITSVLYFVVIHYTWTWSRWRTIPLLLLFLSIDIPFVAANLLKFFDGGYIPILLGTGFFIVMAIWRRGRGLLAVHLQRRTVPLDRFLSDIRGATRLPGVVVAMASNPQGAPHQLVHLLQHFKVMHQTTLLLTVTTERIPHVDPATRVHVTTVGEGVHRVVVRCGFMETPDVPGAMKLALDQLNVATVEQDGVPEVLYLLGRETVVPSSAGEMSLLPETIFAFLVRNARNATDHFGLPPTQVVEVGSQVDL
jgi:KUP system potassium uptake protein